jgi:tetratricopeptide (TPR) repeat protein
MMRSAPVSWRSANCAWRAFVAAILWTLLLAGCASTPPRSTTPSADPPAPAATGAEETERPAAESTPPPRQPRGQNATLALVQQSQRAEAAGSLDEAIAYAERAIRINPRAPDLWLRLASLELTNEQPESTIQYANKALSLIRSRPDWQRQAWLLIADARSALGDEQEAEAIRARWKTYRG